MAYRKSMSRQQSSKMWRRNAGKSHKSNRFSYSTRRR